MILNLKGKEAVLKVQKFRSLPCVLLIFLAFSVFLDTPPRAAIFINDVALGNVEDSQELASFLENLSQKKIDNGLTNFSPYSLLLIKKSLAALKRKNYDKAELMAEYARKLSPDLPPVYTTIAKVQWSKNKILLHKLIIGYVQAFMKSIQHPEVLAIMIFTTLSVITGAFLLTLGLFAAISMLKYLISAYHDFRHVITDLVPNKALWGIGLIIFMLPLFFGFSIFPVFIYWLILLFSYHSKRERYVITGFIVLFALMPLVISTAGLSIYLPQSGLVRLLWKANQGYWNQNDIDGLEEYYRKYPQEQDVLFTLGLLHKKEKNYRTSEKYYQKLMDLNPADYKAQTNLGNVCFATDRWDAAVEKYKTAISIAPALSAAAHFNLARAYQQKFMFKEAEQELSASKLIDSSRIDEYLKIYSENYNRLLIDETISKKRLLEKLYFLFDQSGDLTGELWRLLFKGVPLPYGPSVVIALLFFSLIFSRKDKLRIAVKCKSCDEPICKRCQSTTAGEMMCYQCLHLLKSKEGSGYSLREATKSKILRHFKTYTRIGSLLSLLFPGAGHIWKGQPIKGSICLFTFFVLLLEVISVFVIEGPWEVVAPSDIAGAVLLIVFLILFWLLLLLEASRIKDKSLEDSLLLRTISKKRD